MMITANELANDTVAVVLAGGKGTRLGALTRHVCKPAVPFGAAYRSIDFSLSDCVNSGIPHIGVATQHNPESLLRHVEHVWRGATGGRRHGVTPWPAERCAPSRGYRGTADAVFCNLDTIEALRSRLVLILAGDHIYKMDYRSLLAYHCDRNANVTIGCVDVPIEDAHQFGIMSVDDAGRIRRFVEKPQTVRAIPSKDGRVLASMGIYVFDAGFLRAELGRDAVTEDSGHDFGRDILPRLIGHADVFAYAFRGRDGRPRYWRDIGTPSAYWRAHLDLLGRSPSLELDDPSWPLSTAPRARESVPRYVARNASGSVEDALLANGCSIRRATIRRSVLFSDVKVSAHSEVSDSVVLPSAVIGTHCSLHGVIVDSGCHVPDGTMIDSSVHGDADVRRRQPIVVTAENVRARLSPIFASPRYEGAVA